MDKNKDLKFSKELLLLKSQYKLLCKLKKYEEAESVKNKADLKEIEEKKKYEELL